MINRTYMRTKVFFSVLLFVHLLFFEVERTCVYVAVSQRGLPLREHEEQKKKKLTIPSKPYHAQRKVCLSPHLSPMHLVPLGERPWFSSPILFGRRVRHVVLVVPHGRRVHTLPFQLFFLHGRAHLCQSRAGGVYPSHSVKQGKCAPLGIC